MKLQAQPANQPANQPASQTDRKLAALFTLWSRALSFGITFPWLSLSPTSCTGWQHARVQGTILLQTPPANGLTVYSRRLASDALPQSSGGQALLLLHTDRRAGGGETGRGGVGGRRRGEEGRRVGVGGGSQNHAPSLLTPGSRQLGKKGRIT